MTAENNTITISEAASILGISSVALKRWERLGKVAVIYDPLTNTRLYDLKEIQSLKEKQIDTEEEEEEPA